MKFRGAEVRKVLGLSFRPTSQRGASQSCFGQALLAKAEFRQLGFVAERALAGGVGFGAGGVPGHLWVATLTAQAFHAKTHDLQPSIRLPQIVTGEVTQRQEAVLAFGFRGASATKEKGPPDCASVAPAPAQTCFWHPPGSGLADALRGTYRGPISSPWLRRLGEKGRAMQRSSAFFTRDRHM